MKKIKKYLVQDLLIILLISLTPLLWFKSGYMINGGDTDFPLSPLKWFSSRFFVWNSHYNAGLDYSHAPGGLFFHSLQAMLSCLRCSIISTQKIFLIIWFSAMGLAIYYLMTVIEKKKPDRIARLIAVCFYCFNVYLLNVWVNIKAANLSAYVATPIILAIFIKGLERKINYLKGALLIGVVSIIGSACGVNPPIFMISALVILFYYLFFLFNREVTTVDKKKSIIFLLLIFVIFALFNAYWLLPELHQVLSKTAQAGVNLSSFQAADWLRGVSRQTSLLNVARMQGAWDWYDGWSGEDYVPYAKVYISNTLLIILSFIVPIMVYSTILISKNRYVPFFIALAIFGTLFASGAHPPFGYIYLWMTKHIPFFFIFRSPWYKFTLMLAMAYACLMGIVTSRICQKLSSICEKKIINNILIVFFISIIVVSNCIYTFPMFTGDVITKHKKMPSYLVKIPQYVFNSGQWLESHEEDCRIISLPAGASNYKWGWGSSTHIFSLFVDRSVLCGNFGAEQTIKLGNFIYEALYNNLTPNVSKICYLLNIHYILQQNDIWYDMSGGSDSPEFIKSKLDYQKGIYLEKTIGEWDFYKTNKKSSHIFAVSKATLIKGGIDSLAALSYSNLLNNPSLIFIEQQDSRLIQNFLDGDKVDNLVIYNSLMQDIVFDVIEEQFRYKLPDKNGIIYLNILDREPYEIWVKTNKVNNENNKKVKIIIDEEEIILNKIRTGLKRHNGSKWVYLGDIVLPIGTHTLRLSNGFNAEILNEFIVIPKHRFETYASKINALIENPMVNFHIFFSADKIESTIEEERLKDSNNLRKDLSLDQSTFINHVNISKEGNYRINIYPYFQQKTDTLMQEFKTIEINGQKISLKKKQSSLCFCSESINFKKGPCDVAINQVNLEKYYVEFVQEGLSREKQIKPMVSYTKHNPTLYKIQVESTHPYFLIFSESFHPQWRAYISKTLVNNCESTNNESKFEMIKGHFMINGYANGWYINDIGKHEIILRFYPQRSFVIGGVISLSALSLIVICVIIRGVKFYYLKKR